MSKALLNLNFKVSKKRQKFTDNSFVKPLIPKPSTKKSKDLVMKSSLYSELFKSQKKPRNYRKRVLLEGHTSQSMTYNKQFSTLIQLDKKPLALYKIRQVGKKRSVELHKKTSEKNILKCSERIMTYDDEIKPWETSD